MTRVLRPKNLDALWEALALPRAMPLAGGTDVLVWRRIDRINSEVLVSLQDLKELRGVTFGVNTLNPGAGGQGPSASGQPPASTTLCIGANETLAGLLDSALIREHVPALHTALKVLGSPLVRASATLGGNVVTASPGGDALPPLVAYGADVELISATGTRHMPVTQFILGPGRTALEPGELLRAIHVHDGQRFQLQHFEKVGKRTALACAVASLAALVRLDAGGQVLEARLAWGAVAPTVLQCRDAEDLLLGTSLEPEALRRAGDLARACAQPLTDLRASAEYRRKLVGNLLLRLATVSCPSQRQFPGLVQESGYSSDPAPTSSAVRSS